MGRLRFLTAGESHGPALGVTIEGVPAGLALGSDDLAVDLARRQRGYGRGGLGVGPCGCGTACVARWNGSSGWPV